MPSHLTKRHNVWFARLNVPADVQPAFGGRKIFIRSTGQSEPKRANAIAAPMVAAWQRRIDEARRLKPDPGQAEIDRLTSDYKRLKMIDPDGATSLLIFDVTQFVFERLGGMTADQRRQTLIAAGGNVVEAASKRPATVNAFDQITGRVTPFLAHFEAWKAATHLKGKTFDMACSVVKKFATAVPDASLETLTGSQVQKWIEGMMRPTTGKAISSATMGRSLSSLRNYWEWLQSHDLVPEATRPFWNRKITGSKTETEEANEDRQRFEPTEVVQLWRAAEEKGDIPLANAIKIGAYSGARREGICTLKTTSIKTDPDTKTRFLHVSEKTRAGKRDIPIHSEIADLIDQLARDADHDGWLVPSDENQYGNRGDLIGKRFTKLKRELGFDNKHVFHSIRHTVAHLFESAECPENVAKDVIGHIKVSMTYGLYSGVTKLDLRAKWMEKAIFYPIA